MSLVVPKSSVVSFNERRRKTMFDIRLFEPHSNSDLDEIKQNVENKESKLANEPKKINYLTVSHNNIELDKFRSSSEDRLDKLSLKK
jgi:hypothetical protein